MTPQTLRRIVRELEIRARLEARLDSKMSKRRVEPPPKMCELHGARYMREYNNAYLAFGRSDQRD